MKYINYKKIICVVLSGFIIITTGCGNKNYKDLENNNIEYNEDINNTKNDIKEDKNDTKNDIKEDKNNTKNDIKENSNNTSNINEDTNNTINNQDNKLTESDKIVINEFSELEEKTITLLNSKKTEDVKNKLKGVFIVTVDFIFCDGEINGIKFDDLSDGAKKNILNTAKSIDDKITKVYPTYKEDITDVTKDVYNKASNLIKKGANNLNEFAKESLGDENYKSLIKAKDELEVYTKDAISIIGNLGSKAFETGKDKVKKWYYNFKTGN